MSYRFLFGNITAATLILGCGVVFATSPVEPGGEYEQALSLTPNLENGRRAYLMCAVCHRPEGGVLTMAGTHKLQDNWPASLSSSWLIFGCVIVIIQL